MAAVLAGCGALLILFISRSEALPEGPQAVVWDRTPCAECRMSVGEPPFAAQLQTHDGRVLDFDDHGCLFRYVAENAPEVHAIYFHHVREDRWIPESRALFVPAGPSPMAYNLGAIEAGEAAAANLGAIEAGEAAAASDVVAMEELRSTGSSALLTVADARAWCLARDRGAARAEPGGACCGGEAAGASGSAAQRASMGADVAGGSGPACAGGAGMSAGACVGGSAKALGEDGARSGAACCGDGASPAACGSAEPASPGDRAEASDAH